MSETSKLQLGRFVPLIIMLTCSVGLAFWMHDFVRDVIVRPMLLFGWLVTMAYNSLSDFLLWSLFLCIGGIIALRSLVGGPRRTQSNRDGEVMAGGAVSDWSRLVEHAAQSGYSRWQLSQSLCRLSWHLLQDDRSKRFRDIEAGLRGQTLSLPPDIQAYFEAGMSTYQPVPKLKQRLGLASDSAALSLDPSHVIDYLEARLDPLIEERSAATHHLGERR